MKRIHLLLVVFFSLLAGFASAQTEDQSYTLHRFHVAPGEGAAFEEVFTKISGAYRTGTDVNFNWYAFDNDTYEVVTPIKDMATLDWIDAQFSFVRNSLSKEEQMNMVDGEKMSRVVIGQENMVIEYAADLSYVAPDSPYEGSDPTPYYRINTFEVDYADWPKVYEHGKKLVALMEQYGSKVDLEFYTYDIGGRMNAFEVAYPGQSEAELKRRMTEDEKLGGAELKEWRTEAMKIAKMVKEVNGRYVPGLSSQKSQEPSNLFAVSMESFTPGKEKEYAAAYAKIKDALRRGKADLYWTSSVMEDGQVYNSVPIDRMSDLDVIYEQFRKRRYQLEPQEMAAFYQELNTMNEGQQTIVARYHPDFSYEKPAAAKPGTYQVFRQQEYSYDPKDRAAAMTLLGEIKAMHESKGAKIPYQIFTYEMGGPSNHIIVRDFGTNRATLDADIAADMKILGEPELEGSIMARIIKHLTPVSTGYGRVAPEFAYEKE